MPRSSRLTDHALTSTAKNALMMMRASSRESGFVQWRQGDEHTH